MIYLTRCAVKTESDECLANEFRKKRKKAHPAVIEAKKERSLLP